MLYLGTNVQSHLNKGKSAWEFTQLAVSHAKTIIYIMAHHIYLPSTSTNRVFLTMTWHPPTTSFPLGHICSTAGRFTYSALRPELVMDLRYNVHLCTTGRKILQKSHGLGVWKANTLTHLVNGNQLKPCHELYPTLPYRCINDRLNQRWRSR